jgi:pyrroline-5-carboxylate reductase
VSQQSLFKNVLLIGAGNIGSSVLRCLTRDVYALADKFSIVERNLLRQREAREIGVDSIFSDLDGYEGSPDLVILSVKPQEAQGLLQKCTKKFPDQPAYLSLMAGVTVASLQEGTGARSIVRCMPNLAAQQQLSATVSFAAKDCAPDIATKIWAFLERLGKNYVVKDESLVDAATALSGSGPGFIFYVIEQFAKAAEKLGFSAELGERLILDTFIGSVRLIENSPSTAAELRRQVSSPGGTTEAGVKVFEESGLGEGIVRGILAARARSEELGKLIEEQFKEMLAGKE